MLILSDDFAQEDLIGNESYRDGLVDLIRSVDSKGSFTIGVYGQWGIGKTSLLRQIKYVFDNPASKDDPPVLTVWFNPWQFVADDHLIIPFFHTLIASLGKKATKSTIQKVKEKIPSFLNKIAHVPLALVYGMEGKFKIPFLLETKIIASKTMDYQQKADEEINEKISQKHKTAIEVAVEKYESTYYNLIQILHDAAAELDLKIVVFIDDLDRCLPEKAVQLLEGLKVLLDIPNFIFVMGVAQEIIERGIRVRYRDLYKTDQYDDLPNIEGEYLDKIIQFPFSLPSANPDKLKQNILNSQLRKLKGAEPFVELIHEVLGSNPRTLKRFINAISFSLYLAEKNIEADIGFHPELLIKISLVGYLFPALYRQLEKYPGHLVRLENIVKEIELERTKKKGAFVEKLMEEHSPQVKMTDLPIIDQWLDDEKFSKLYPILRIREATPNGKRMEGASFNDRETVTKYMRLLSTSMHSEVVSKTKDISTFSIPLSKEMQERMILIPAGEFIMGDKDADHVEVKISRPFLMDKYPVTQALYQKVMNTNPSHFKGEDLPVDNISWYDAIEFCNELSEHFGLEKVYEVDGKYVKINYEGNGYRIPTEAEWEYACRGNATGHHYGELKDIAWYKKNSGKQSQGVGQKMANGFGLYDMLGNVWEWCNDWYEREYPKGQQINPVGPDKGIERVIRGGSWANSPDNLRLTYRNRKDPFTRDNNQGIRVVLNQHWTEES